MIENQGCGGLSERIYRGGESRREKRSYAWGIETMGNYVVEVAFQCCRTQGRTFRGDETFGKLANVSGSHGGEREQVHTKSSWALYPVRGSAKGPPANMVRLVIQSTDLTS